MLLVERDGVEIFHGDALDCYASWPTPAVIVSDGPYGLGLFPGEPTTAKELAEWYRPHARSWAAAATPATTLFFWNTEIGWALSHPALEDAGWDYVGLNTWDKTLAHLAGNVNTATMRRFPPVTEVCAHYVRKPPASLPGGSVQGWLRAEWARTGLAWRDANAACGVADAASRKWLTADECWYPPPPAMFELLERFANRFGDAAGAPYFDLAVFDEPGRSGDADGQLPGERWAKLRPRFVCPFGVSNVWTLPAVRGPERLRLSDGATAHPNQKPVAFMERLLKAASGPGEVVWDPFMGTGSTLIAAWRLGRRGFGAEVDRAWADGAARRLLDEPAALFSAAAVGDSAAEPLFLFGPEASMLPGAKGRTAARLPVGV